MLEFFRKIRALFSPLYQKYKDNNFAKLGILILAVIIVVLYYNSFLRYTPVQKMQLKDSIFCQTSYDCELYDCTNCGNKLWIDNNTKKIACNKNVPGLVGCACVSNICKRVYGK